MEFDFLTVVNPEDVDNVAYEANPIGEMIAPLWTFEFYNNNLKKSNPELIGKPQVRAATVYFSILARNPQVTSSEVVDFFPIDVDSFKTNSVEELLSSDYWFSRKPSGGMFDLLDYKIWKQYIQQAPAKDVYLYNVHKLQQYLIKQNLWDGVQKTLNEESRKLQSQMASLQAAKAEAARALAISRMTTDLDEQARVEQAQAQAKAEDNYNKLVEKEEDIRQQLDNIANGLPADFGQSKTNWTPVLIAGGIAALLLMKRGK